jgi:hypothetical protein
MGVLDQASRYAAQTDPEVVLSRVLRGVSVSLRFRAWVDTRTTPRPGHRDRTADRVAELVRDDAPDLPWLLVFEFQAQHDPDKLDVTLAEAGQLRLEARHGEGRQGKYNILVALVYLRGSCPEAVLDMTLPGGWGTKHAPLVWNVADDVAREALDALEAGTMTWGILFWIPLMRGGDDPAVLARWREQASRVENVRVRADLIRIALVFAELAGRLVAWSNAMKEWNMIESQLVWEWTADARREAEVTTRREDLLLALKERFPDLLSEEAVGVINQQESIELLRDWFRAALRASSLEEFLAVLRR